MANEGQPVTIVNLVHENSVGILPEVGFCVPEGKVIAGLDQAGFPVDT